MEISGILDPRCIKLDLEAREKRAVIGELIRLAAAAGLVTDIDGVEQAILAREALMSTGIGEGVALPHALIAGFERTVMAVGRCRDGIDFDSLDRAPVQLVLLIVGRKGQERSHMALLSHLARVLSDASLKRGMLDAASPLELAAILGQAP